MRICLNMIVKNEATVISRCLSSVRPYIDAWAIVDTGSTDGTQEIIRDFLRSVPGNLVERSWVDFATNRNDALHAAKEFGDYAIFIDADDRFEAAPDFRFPSLQAPCYLVESIFSGVSSWVETLARLDVDWRWNGVLHEVLTSPQPIEREKLSGMRLVKHTDGARNRDGVRAKYARDAETLERALRDGPNNSRYQFYLAQSLREAGRYADAHAAYRRRAEMGGSAQEIYYSKLMVAVLAEQVGSNDAQIVSAFEDAYRYRPQRAETMTRFAHYLLRKGRIAQARDCAMIACNTPPSDDTLLVDVDCYIWRPHDDLAMALFRLGDKLGCAEIYRRLVADSRVPVVERDRMQRNLERITGSSVDNI
jgi:glycosyltransferase involved in cell wall biosynthesis